MNKSTNIHQLEAGILYSLTRGRQKKTPPCRSSRGGRRSRVSLTHPQETQPQILLYHIQKQIAIDFRRFVLFLFYEQNYFVNFVYSEYCNLGESMLYYNHNRGGTVQWQSKLTALIRKTSRAQRDLNKTTDDRI